MDLIEKDTVSIEFVRAAVARLNAEQRAQVLAQAQIEDDLLGADAARVSAESFAALWLAVAHQLDDEFFGLDSRRMKAGSFALLCRALSSCQDLEHALHRMLRGFATFLDDISGELRIVRQEAEIVLSNRIREPGARRFAEETWLVMVHGLMCGLTGQRIPLTHAAFAFPAPPHAAEYALMFSQSLSFNAPATSIRFDARHLGTPLAADPRALTYFLRTAPRSVVLKFKNEDSWTARARRSLRAGLDAQGGLAHNEWPSFVDLARVFQTTPTTLRRRLLAEGTSYQAIKEGLRRDAAIHHLCHSTMSLADIAAALGFRDTSSFHRAFRTWCGTAPGSYRARLRP